jgi:hypothetical protein
MRLFRYAAAFAVAAIPFVLFRKRRPLPGPSGAQVVETDHIFDLELRAD